MRVSLFYSVLLVVNVILFITLWQFHSDERYSDYLDLSIIGVAILNLFNLIVFYLARYYSKISADKKYMQLIFGNFLLKLIIIIGIPVVYYLIKQPDENWFIVPFIVIYLVFTIFETWHLNLSAIMRKG